MRAVGYLLVASVVLAAAQAVAAALVVALMLAIVIGVFRYPRETFGLLGMGCAFTVIDRQPLVAIVVVTMLGVVSLVAICRADESA